MTKYEIWKKLTYFFQQVIIVLKYNPAKEMRSRLDCVR